MSNVSKVVTGAVALLVVNTLSILLAGWIGVQVVKHEISSALDESGLASSSSDTSPFAGQHASATVDESFFGKVHQMGATVGQQAQNAVDYQRGMVGE